MSDRIFSPPVDRGASYPEVLAEARSFISSLADAIDGRVWGRLRTGSLPSTWVVQRGWAIRCAVAAAAAMSFAVHNTMRPSRWSALEVLAPVWAIVCCEATLGKSLEATIALIKGSLIGGIMALMVVGTTRNLTSQFPDARDPLGFLFFVVATLYLTSVSTIWAL